MLSHRLYKNVCVSDRSNSPFCHIGTSLSSLCIERLREKESACDKYNRVSQYKNTSFYLILTMVTVISMNREKLVTVIIGILVSLGTGTVFSDI